MKIIYASIGMRDRYEVARGLQENGLLEFLVCDFCVGRDSKYNKVKYIKKRSLNWLSSNKIKIARLALIIEIFRLLLRGYSKRINDYGYLLVGYFVGRFAHRQMKKRDDLVLVCDSYVAIGIPKNRNYKLIINQVHPPAIELKKIYESIGFQQSKYESISLLQEEEISSPGFLRKKLMETVIADQYLCASQFTADLILKLGVDKKSVSVIPYGVESNNFELKDSHFKKNKKEFTVCFVGKRSGRKNVGLLIEIWTELNLENSRLIFIGDSKNIEEINDINGVEFNGRLRSSELESVISKCDFLILPSIAEGFGLVLLEALSLGVPFIATKNSGAIDINKYQVSGLIFDPLSKESIRIALCSAYNERHKWTENSKRYIDVAKKYSWNRYRNETAKKIEMYVNDYV